MSAAAAAPADGPAGASRLELRFVRAPDGRTYLDRQYAAYPFHVCRTQYVEGDEAGMATLYMQSSSGGMYEHDRHSIRMAAATGAKVHVTTQASTIVHSMAAGEARLDAVVTADERSFMEYLPDPVILFPGARLRSSVAVTLAEAATVLVADAFLCHDPGGSEATFEVMESTTRVVDADGRLLARDRFSIGGAEFARHRAGVNGPFAAHGTLMLARRRPAGDEHGDALLSCLRAALDATDGVYGGASTLPGDLGVWVRMLAVDGAALRAGMIAAWSAMRVGLFGRVPTVRRK